MEDLLHWLHEQPLVLSFLLVVSAFVVPTLLGTHLLQPYFAKTLRNEREANTITGVALSTVSLFYAVLLGLLSLAVFQNYTYADQTTELEAQHYCPWPQCRYVSCPGWRPDQIDSHQVCR